MLATELTTIILPYFWSFGAAFGYDCLDVILPMAGGAYFSAKKGAIEFASKHFCRSEGVVASSEGGPKSPEEQTQISSLPHEFSTSSMRPNVSSSLATLKGYPMILVLGESLATSSIRVS